MRFLSTSSLFISNPIRSFDSFFFFNDTATTEIYTLSLHDALPICCHADATARAHVKLSRAARRRLRRCAALVACSRSEEHTSELQSRPHLVCRLLLEKKKIALIFPCCCHSPSVSNLASRRAGYSCA